MGLCISRDDARTYKPMEQYLVRLAETHGEETEPEQPSPGPVEGTLGESSPAPVACAVAGHGSYLSNYPEHGLDFESRSGFNPRDPLTQYKHNQDYVLVKDKLDGMQGQMLMLVLDGHGAVGDKVSEKASKMIRDNLVKLGNGSESKLLYTDVPMAFSEAFAKTDAELAKDPECRHSGTTCVAMLIRGNDIWVANVGDSRAVMARRVEDQIEGIPLTRDHKPNEPDERARIRAAGGRINASVMEETQRVWTGGDHAEYGLAMSRSLGDFVLKKWGVISEPEVIHTTFSRNDVFFCLATDGVWDVIEPQELVSTVTKCISANPPIKPAAYVVGHTAKLWQMQFPGCYVDDSTLVVAIVDHPLGNTQSCDLVSAEAGNIDFLPLSVKRRLDGSAEDDAVTDTDMSVDSTELDVESPVSMQQAEIASPPEDKVVEAADVHLETAAPSSGDNSAAAEQQASREAGEAGATGAQADTGSSETS